MGCIQKRFEPDSNALIILPVYISKCFLKHFIKNALPCPLTGTSIDEQKVDMIRAFQSKHGIFQMSYTSHINFLNVEICQRKSQKEQNFGASINWQWPFLRACHTRAKIRMNSKKVDYTLLLCEYFEDARLCLKSREGCQRQGDPGKHTVTSLFRSPSTGRTMSCSIVLCCFDTKKREFFF